MSEQEFQVKFYGVRGSIPTPLIPGDVRNKLLAALEMATPEDLESAESRESFVDKLPDHINGCIGGNSSCVHIKVAGKHIIFDGGSGLRVLGLDLFKQGFAEGKGEAHLLFSHTHWDHILGVPFFGPLYVPGNKFTICAVHDDIRTRLAGQQEYQYFPVPIEAFNSDLSFVNLSAQEDLKVGDATVTWKLMEHPGKSYSYRIDYGGRSVVFSTDSEYKSKDAEYLQPTVDFFRDADLVIFDAQYTLSEALYKVDWGHSSTYMGIDIALKAGVKKVAFFHHEPTYSDFKLVEILKSSQEFLNAIAPDSPLKLELASEGLVIDLFNS